MRIIISRQLSTNYSSPFPNARIKFRVFYFANRITGITFCELFFGNSISRFGFRDSSFRNRTQPNPTNPNPNPKGQTR